MLSIEQTSPSGGSGAQHQKGCISNGRSPVVWFSISRSEILKLIARRAIPHPLNLLNLLNPLNPSRRAAPMGVHFQRAQPDCLVFHFAKRNSKTHRPPGRYHLPRPKGPSPHSTQPAAVRRPQPAPIGAPLLRPKGAEPTSPPAHYPNIDIRKSWFYNKNTSYCICRPAGAYNKSMKTG